MNFLKLINFSSSSKSLQRWFKNLTCLLVSIAFIGWSNASKPQFYIQLLYRPHLGTWFLPFGLLGSKWKISETMEFLLKYATFWGGFFMFSWGKFLFFFFIISLHFSVCTKKLFHTKVNLKKKIGKNSFWVKNKLPLMIFWLEIMSVIQRGALKTSCI